ncbi:unnamed protein product [Staurois parvus]|uniref:Uncharacterized protein n=1 Tax=Staurois parvus TaxID=386267 RepID=A0ABN9ENG2_9NEOB|nr:unnamed protein product [Staurois parvus]
MQRKLIYKFPLWFVKPVLGPVAWRFLRDLGGMKNLQSWAHILVAASVLIAQVCAGLFVEART